jgi:hypothetical protein
MNHRFHTICHTIIRSARQRPNSPLKNSHENPRYRVAYSSGVGNRMISGKKLTYINKTKLHIDKVKINKYFWLNIMNEAFERSGWLKFLTEEDLSFLKRFLLASGSLKGVAGQYGISYPTVRIRLDRLIAKVEAADRVESGDDYERLLRAMCAEGKYDARTLRQLLDAYERVQEGAES